MKTILNKEVLIAYSFFIGLFAISFGSVGTSLSNNNIISYGLLISIIPCFWVYRKELHLYFYTGLAICLSLMLASFLFSSLLSEIPNTQNVINRFLQILLSICYGFVAFILLKKKVLRLENIFIFFSLAGLFHVILLLILWFAVEKPESYNWIVDLIFFNNIRHLADFISICFICSFYFVLSKNKLHSLSFFVICTLILSFVFWSGSRAAYISIIISCSLILMYEMKLKLLLYSIAIIALSVILSSLFHVDNSAFNLTQTLKRSVGNASEVTSGRTKLYYDVWQYYLHQPFLGHGGEAVRELNIYHGTRRVVQAHNSVLQILVEYGAIGLILLVVTILKIIKDLIKIKLQRHIVFLLAISLNILLASLMNGGAYYVVTMSILCVMIGALYAFRQENPIGKT